MARASKKKASHRTQANQALRGDHGHNVKLDAKIRTVRDVKGTTTDHKLNNPKLHGFSRFLLPVASSVVAGQGSPGQHTERTTDDISTFIEEDQSSLTFDLAQDDLVQQIKVETNTQKNFQNNDGSYDGDLKLPNAEAIKQLESYLTDADQTTPDSWVPRSQDLIRLTGVHPLNAEVEAGKLFDAGIITPPKLHYVRNHGTVPQLDWETHNLSVSADPDGLTKDAIWTMYQLTDKNKFAIVELPITIACDGNRRKEMKANKLTSGANFSISGVSTSLWRGIFVRQLLQLSGVKTPPVHERWYVNFEGADVYGTGAGTYGYATCIPLEHVMDETNDVMLAFGMNGYVLPPDHGYPLRVVIPGYVGGRQVKWVHKIWVTKNPQNTHFQKEDNRVYPSFVTKRDAVQAAFSESENTLCNEQILQSAICKPAHGETVTLTTSKYTFKGWAYNGSGLEISRVELTLDGGESWRYCFKQYVPKPLRHGEKHWAWIFWSCDVPMGDIVKAKEIVVRAVDARMNSQPERLTWNLTGMMNNSWYRIQFTEDSGKKVLQFKHPVTNLPADDGWMKPPIIDWKPDPTKDTKAYTLEQVAENNNEKKAWLIMDTKVYDVTNVLSWHPGGKTAILSYAGKATPEAAHWFKAIHDCDAKTARDLCLIGHLTDDAIKQFEANAQKAAKVAAEIVKEKEARKGITLQPDSYARAKLLKRTEIPQSSLRTYRFQLAQNGDKAPDSLQLDIGRHLLLGIHFDDQAVIRAYSPIAPILKSEDKDGTFTLCVKTFLPDDKSSHPSGGLVSNYLDCMQEGEEVDLLGPVGNVWYSAPGKFTIADKSYPVTKINLLSAGTGIPPHWQVLYAILADKDDKTVIKLIDYNVVYADIMLRVELQDKADKNKARFDLWHVLSTAPPTATDWKYTVGQLTETIMSEHFYKAEDGVLTLVCDPEKLIDKVATDGLAKLGFKMGTNLFTF